MTELLKSNDGKRIEELFFYGSDDQRKFTT